MCPVPLTLNVKSINGIRPDSVKGWFAAYL
jgi:hypothetical protein